MIGFYWNGFAIPLHQRNFGARTHGKISAAMEYGEMVYHVVDWRITGKRELAGANRDGNTVCRIRIGAGECTVVPEVPK
jgi:hypothetical protein